VSHTSAITPYDRVSVPVAIEARISLLGLKIPCSGRKDSLFRAEQGIFRNSLISHREKAAPAPKKS
jgi:hypothetical protein